MSDEEDFKQLLTQHRLQDFTEKLIHIGVTGRVDLENVESQNLSEMGMSQIQKNRFRKMVTSLGLRRWDSTESMASVSSVQLQLQEHGSLSRKRPRFCSPQTSGYTLNYVVLQSIDRYEVKSIPNLQADITTIDTLKETILKNEKLQGSHLTSELFTTTGVPLSNDTYLSTWTLNKRCIKTNSTICVILRDSNIGRRGYQMWDDTTRSEQGAEYIFCETSHGEYHKIQVNLEKDTPQDVKKKMAYLASIPDSVQHLRLPGSSFTLNCHTTLQNNGIKEGDTILIDIQSVDSRAQGWLQNFNCDVQPHVEQTRKGLSTFACFLCVVVSELNSNCLRLIRELTNWPPLIVALKKLADRSSLIFCEQVAVVEGLYFLFRRILPANEVQDKDVFEHSALCWAYLLHKSKGNNSNNEFKEIGLNCSHCKTRLFLPVNVPRKGEVMCIHDFEKDFANGTSDDEALRCSADLDMQQLLLCYPLTTESCHVWDPPSNVTLSSRMKDITGKSLNDLRAIQSKFDRLKIKPPLQLKGGSTPVPLVTLNEFGK
ncbi:uncharacterized protein [Amphiura filiformis]|uniref:uncharacterized protein n=1 Tax=Amphiura filiformis TaxID=82378 RepID=UPI003B21A189